MNADFLSRSLSLLSSALLEHWATRSFAAHKAFESFYDSVRRTVDDVVETYQGRYSTRLERPTSLDLSSDFPTALAEYEAYLLTSFPGEVDKVRDPDLLNMRDELLGHCRKIRYLLTLE